MEPKVLETSSPIIRTSQMLDKKGIISLDVIDVDEDERSADIMFIHKNFDSSDKGKGICHKSDHKLKGPLASCSYSPDVEILGSVDADSSFTLSSQNLINADDHFSDLSNEDDEWIEPILDDLMDVDEYSVLQAHFDHMDIPPDIEAPIPWLPDGQDKKKPNIKTSSFLSEPQMQSDSLQQQGKSPVQFESSVMYLNLQAQVDSFNHPPGINKPLPWFLSQDVQSNKKSATSRNREKSVSPHQVSYTNSLLGLEAAKSRWFLDPFKRKKKLHGSNNISINQLDAMKLHNGGEPSFGISESDKKQKQVGSLDIPYSNSPAYMEVFGHPPEVGPSMPEWPDIVKMKTKKPIFFNHTSPGFYDPSDPLYPTFGEVVDMPWAPRSVQNQADAAAGNSTGETISSRDMDEVLRNFEHFKQFDTVEDHSDHHYTSHGFSLKQLSKKWAKRIQEEWKMLEKDLPADTIFVRVYESRMDLLRAVIIGAEGTPYHDGLFFFDVFFPPNYPDAPPHVYYHSGGLRLNPNLYDCGKVCLSLLNTWTGSANEKWIPGVSTMLQVLVSIQGLILNTKPYFNEPGFAYQSGSAAGENRSQRYNEDTYLLSIKTMVYNIRRPPKHFEDFVRGHFGKKGHDILVACKAYMDGAQVGSLVKGGVQDLDVGDKSCSMIFKHSLSQHLRMLVNTFKRIGVDDCEKFLPVLPITHARKRHAKASGVKIESLEGEGAEKLILG